MKLYVGLAAAAAVAAMMGAALAAEGDQFVIRGDAAKQLLEQNSINIATAEKIAKVCVDEATKQGVRVSIAIYDQYGEPVYMYRMDGQAKIAIETAMIDGVHSAAQVRGLRKVEWRPGRRIGRSSECSVRLKWDFCPFPVTRFIAPANPTRQCLQFFGNILPQWFRWPRRPRRRASSILRSASKHLSAHRSAPHRPASARAQLVGQFAACGG